MRDIEIGNKVRLARVEAGLTQQQLASAIGITRQTVAMIALGLTRLRWGSSCLSDFMC